MNADNNSVVLRFSNFEDIKTIDEHQRIIDKYGMVYWGVWKKPYEKIIKSRKKDIWNYMKYDTVFGEFKLPVTIWLCNINSEKAYKATCNRIIKNKDLNEENKKLIPLYYNNSKISKPTLYFSLSVIEEYSYDKFYKSFKEKKMSFATDDIIFVENFEGNDLINKYIKVEKNSILHISDLHFGSAFNYNDGTPQRRTLPSLVDKFNDIKEKYKIGLIVASGDFSYGKDRNNSAQNQANFTNAEKLLRELCNLFDLDPTKHLLLVPGNHDKGFVDDIGTDKKIIDPLTSKTNNNYDQEYRNFQKKLIGVEQLTYTKFYEFPEKTKVHFVCLDSSDLQSMQTREYGYIAKRQLDIIKNTSIDKDAVCFSVMHHPLLLPPARNAVSSFLDDKGKYHAEAKSVLENSFEIVKGLTDNGYIHILHGHQHYPYFGRYVMRDSKTDKNVDVGFYSAGTLGLNNSNTYPEFPYNSFNIYTISDELLKVDVYRFLVHEDPIKYDDFSVECRYVPK